MDLEWERGRMFDMDVGGMYCKEFSIAKTEGFRNLKLEDSNVVKTLEFFSY